MQTDQFKVSFFVQAKRADKQGDAPIFGRIIIGRSTANFSTKFKTPLTLWDSRRQRLLGKSHVAVQLNQRLNDCTALIHTRYRELCEREESVTASAVRDAYQGQIQEQGFLLATYQAYLTQIEERIGIDRAFYIKRYTFTKKQEKEAKDASRRDFMEQQIDNMEGVPQNRDYWYYFNFPTEQISEKRLYILDSLTVSAETDIADPEMPKEANAALQKARRQVIAGDSRAKAKIQDFLRTNRKENRRKMRI